jgi:hypothetical protein
VISRKGLLYPPWLVARSLDRETICMAPLFSLLPRTAVADLLGPAQGAQGTPAQRGDVFGHALVSWPPHIW